MKTAAPLLKQTLKRWIKEYQKWISPFIGPVCKFYPSCSNYALMSLEKHGCAKTLVLTSIRILKCNPFHPGGVNFP